MLETVKMRNCATFDGEGATLGELTKVNIVYGGNGTGKTTISKVIAEPDLYPECELAWADGRQLRPYVFNRHFRERCVSASDIPGVYTLGEGSAQTVADIERLKGQNLEMEEQLESEKTMEAEARAVLAAEWEYFKDVAWTLKTGVKAKRGVAATEGYYDVFRPAFKGVARKDALARKLVEWSSYGMAAQPEDELRRRAAVLFSEEEPVFADAMPEQARQAGQLLDGLRVVIGDEVWGRPVVGNADLPIAALVNELGCADWLRKGAEYLRGDGVCPFCQQRTVTEDLAAQISAFFDGAFREDVERIELYVGRLGRALDYARAVEQRAAALLEQCPHVCYGQVARAAHDLALAVELTAAQAAKKLEQPSARVELSDPLPALEELVAALTTLDDVAADYNGALSRRSAEAARLVDDVWAFFAHKLAAEVEGYRARARAASFEAEEHKASCEDLQQALLGNREKIVELNKQAATVAAAAQSVNDTLAAHGVVGFKLVEADEHPGCYVIARPDGSAAARTLSEGEEALVAFVYFMQLAGGATSAEGVGEERVLVVDDPATGMDGAARELVLRMLAELACEVENSSGDVRQLMLLSHDKMSCKSLLDADADAAAWTLQKSNEVTTCVEGLVG